MLKLNVLLLSAFLAVTVFAGDAPWFANDLTPLTGDLVFESGEFVLADSSLPPIVYEEDVRGKSAAKYLSESLNEMFGSEVAVYRMPRGASNRFKRCIFVPRPSDGEDFSVEVSASGVRFGGRADYAVYDFCERMLGVRHYWDGPGGRSIPRRNRLVLPCVRYHDAPVFAYRQYYGDANAPWLRVAKGGGRCDTTAGCHTTDPGFCYGSPEGFDEYCRRLDADIAGGERFGRVVNRERKTVSVSPWDVEYDCSCAWCRTLRSHTRATTGSATPILWERFLPRLVRYLAERHPDYRVCVLAYWNYVEAPGPSVELGTNVYAEVCSMSGLARFKWRGMRELEEGYIRDWVRVTGRKTVSWHYSCWPAESTPAPYVYGNTIAEHYRRMRDFSVGTFINSGRDDFPRFALSLYVWMRCLWNPDLDVEAVYDEFCRRQFGAAASRMREVVRIQEREWDPVTLGFSRRSQLRLSELLEESADLVRGTSAADAFLYYISGFSAMFDRREPAK